MKSQLTLLREKQVDLAGDVTFANNEIIDPQFHARGVNGVLPINQQLFLERNRLLVWSFRPYRVAFA